MESNEVANTYVVPDTSHPMRGYIARAGAKYPLASQYILENANRHFHPPRTYTSLVIKHLPQKKGTSYPACGT